MDDLGKNIEKLSKAKKEKMFSETYQLGKPCKSCGSTMKYIFGEMFECPNCGRKEATDFGKVKDYLDTYGPTSAAIIADRTGVELGVIETLLKQGRVEIPDGSGIYIKCEKCGTDIRYGRYCSDCIKKLSSGLNKAMWNPDVGEKPTIKSEMTGKMHIQSKIERVKGKNKKS